MNRQGNACLTCFLSQLPGGILAHVDSLTALVLIAVQPLLGDPGRGGQGGFVDLGKALRVARRAKSCTHRKGLLSPSRRKGVSAA